MTKNQSYPLLGGAQSASHAALAWQLTVSDSQVVSLI